MSPPKQSRKNSVTVEIAGERHILRSDAPPEYTHAVAAHVDATIGALGTGSTLETHRRAVLAALVITDELFRTREELRLLREEVERRSMLLADLLEHAAEEGGASNRP
ncbi:MAG TPA: cell division protein ZapA [Longimicrobiaceae bacterium]|nr:cell division protein ZapA [Longimicrobiaceae bacterium]